ncbi:MAG: hypothetical protein IPK12_18355 [Gemmatimonadetes bacterium]|nr:hypothetical protein [Gemmatimonadota bacterium]
MRRILLLTLLIFLVNLPFGYWRAGLRKLSATWFVAIHAPVILIIAMRLALHMPFRVITLPLYVLAFFSGQSVGGWLRRRKTTPIVA